MTDRLAGQGLGPRGGSVALLASAADATTAPAIVGDLAPAILPRRAWGAPAADGWPVERAPVRAVVVHHTGTANDEPDSLAMLRRVARLHAHERGWGDIGYSFIVLNDGRIAEGRTGSATAPAPDGVVAGHAYGHNVGTVGIALAGRFHDRRPTPAAWASLARLVAAVAVTCDLHTSGGPVRLANGARLPAVISTHRDVGATTCPGDGVARRSPTSATRWPPSSADRSPQAED